MTHKFKAGEQAIVLPTKWGYNTNFNAGRGHWLDPFCTCVIMDVQREILVKGTSILGLQNQVLQYHQLEPMPIRIGEPEWNLEGE